MTVTTCRNGIEDVTYEEIKHMIPICKGVIKGFHKLENALKNPKLHSENIQNQMSLLQVYRCSPMNEYKTRLIGRWRDDLLTSFLLYSHFPLCENFYHLEIDFLHIEEMGGLEKDCEELLNFAIDKSPFAEDMIFYGKQTSAISQLVARDMPLFENHYHYASDREIDAHIISINKFHSFLDQFKQK